MINEIRWNSNKILLDLPDEDVDENNENQNVSFYTCELCAKNHEIKYGLLQCYSYHFEEDLKQMVKEEPLNSLVKLSA